MSYLGESRENFGRPWMFTLCLTAEDCRLLLPTMEKRLKEAEKMYEKYKDIHDGGDATERQENLLLKFEEERDALLASVHQAKELIEIEEKSKKKKKQGF